MCQASNLQPFLCLLHWARESCKPLLLELFAFSLRVASLVSRYLCVAGQQSAGWLGRCNLSLSFSLSLSLSLSLSSWCAHRIAVGCQADLSR